MRLFDRVAIDVQKVLTKLDEQEFWIERGGDLRADEGEGFLNRDYPELLLRFERKTDDGVVETTIHVSGFIVARYARYATVWVGLRSRSNSDDCLTLFNGRYKTHTVFDEDSLHNKDTESRITVEYIDAWARRKVLPRLQANKRNDELKSEHLQKMQEKYVR